jgi:hypothetical protein
MPDIPKNFSNTAHILSILLQQHSSYKSSSSEQNSKARFQVVDRKQDITSKLYGAIQVLHNITLKTVQE